MRFNKFNEEVFFAGEEIAKVSRRDIEFLKQKAENNKRKRARLCLHKSVKDQLHEMMIIHMKDTYVRPHKHLNRGESLYVIEGEAYAVMFDETGSMTDVIRMGDCRSKERFYYKIPGSIYHSLLITTDFFVFHETTSGPFDRSDTVFAAWAPEGNDSGNVAKFMKKLAGTLGNVISDFETK